MCFLLLYIIYYIRARGKREEGEGTLAEMRKAQRQGEGPLRRCARHRGEGEGTLAEKRKALRQDAHGAGYERCKGDSYPCVGISLLLIP